MLRPAERAWLVMYCGTHPVAVCPRCSERLTFPQIGADIVLGTRDFCPRCRADLTDALRAHLAECTVMQIQERELRARRLDEAASVGNVDAETHQPHDDARAHAP